MRMIKFYLKRVNWINKFGFFLPFLVYSKLLTSINKNAVISLKGRVRFGSKLLPLASPKASSLIVEENSKVLFGEGVCIGGGTLLFIKTGAHFEIGDNTYFTSDVHIECKNNIKIGDNCAVSWGVTILDDDHHEIVYDAEDRITKPSEVYIGDKVWIGCNVTILKGTRIGNNCVIAAGSVVNGNFPNNSLIGGNPSKVIKENIDWK